MCDTYQEMMQYVAKYIQIELTNDKRQQLITTHMHNRRYTSVMHPENDKHNLPVIFSLPKMLTNVLLHM